MTLLSIPFCPQMQQANREQRKCCTSRSEKMGEPGDRFRDADGELCQIVDVLHLPLKIIAEYLYRCEGCQSPEEFKALWRRLHRGHYTPEQRYYTHFYTYVRKGEQHEH